MEIAAKNSLLPDRKGMILGLVCLGLFIYAYHDTFLWLVERYDNPDSHYSHGYLIPFICGYLVWMKRKDLAGLPRSSSRLGLGLIIAALLTHVASVWTHTFFTSGFSIMALAVGLCLYFYGPAITRQLAFPLGFLAFMFPLPMRVISAVSFPLKMMVANIGTAIMERSGMPIVREGAVIHLTNATLSVGDPCSGIRSLIALMAMGALFAYLLQAGIGKKLFLFSLSVPVAIATNVLRVCTLIFVADTLGGEWASPEHWFHTTSGLAVFFISMAVLFGIMRVLERPE
ncbi:exosortase 1 [Geobacter metallireducens RCH3]|uniref:Exopolysaccharide synthesis membrane protein H (Exosortase) n=2 Tax=Geobacter metallireducens TaxID=28232 RepID=Q39U42_GEOMG|nr:exopolysaccharide synthesis membrane protein H (exosortase) [Geobacter metallireducens GS-15]EHP87000.1 exosortase 1 [Geobacter metallireducens RCH3]